LNVLNKATEQFSVSFACKMQPAKHDSFDVWLKRSLHTQFDDVLDEPVPEAVCEILHAHSQNTTRGERESTAGGNSSLTRGGEDMLDTRDAAFLAKLSGRVAAVEFAVGAIIRSLPDAVTRRVLEQDLEDILRDTGPGDFGVLGRNEAVHRILTAGRTAS
jgi:hypothetical protein